MVHGLGSVVRTGMRVWLSVRYYTPRRVDEKQQGDHVARGEGALNGFFFFFLLFAKDNWLAMVASKL